MKTLKYVVVSLLILAAIFALFSLLQDRHVAVSRSIVINTPVSYAFESISDMNQRAEWSPWEFKDPTMIISIGEVSKGAGASYSWTSENSGEGKVKYIEVVQNQMIESEVYFDSDGEGSQEMFFFHKTIDGVRVDWEVHMDMGNNPIPRILGRYMDRSSCP